MIAWRVTAYLETADDVTQSDLNELVEDSGLADLATGGLTFQIEGARFPE